MPLFQWNTRSYQMDVFLVLAQHSTHKAFLRHKWCCIQSLTARPIWPCVVASSHQRTNGFGLVQSVTVLNLLEALKVKVALVNNAEVGK
ncbi:hypothetical protein Dimus_022427 [Dionaea muscipula]